MKITELDSKQLRKASESIPLEEYRDNKKAVNEIMNYPDSMTMKILDAFNYGVAIGKNQERNRRKRK